MGTHALHTPGRSAGHGEPTAPWRLSASVTLHCLTGCAIGEVAGFAIGTALGWGNLATIALAVGLAFVFGYLLTSMPLLRSGLTLGAVVPIALAADTVSIALGIAFLAALPVNRWLIARGKGHTVAHGAHR